MIRVAFAHVGRFFTGWFNEIWPGPSTYRAIMRELEAREGQS